MLQVYYIQQYFNTSITVLTNQVWKLLIALFKVPNTGAFTVPQGPLLTRHKSYTYILCIHFNWLFCYNTVSIWWCNILLDASFRQAVFWHWLPGLTCQILCLKKKLLDINIPKQQFEKQTQIININVWTHPSPNSSTFGCSKSQRNWAIPQ